MGREAFATCTFRGQTAQVKALLEAQEIILRGAIRTRLARQSLSAITDSEVRRYMRDHGYIDNKTSGVSDDNSATRYRLIPTN
jgi:hypothetical protein